MSQQRQNWRCLAALFATFLLISSTKSQSPDFSCPEEFGYFPHPLDCTKYYVCVFGGALLESCTGGLEYSHELQTCDWPRNVGCVPGGNNSTNAVGSGSYGQQQQQLQQNNNVDEEVTRLGRRSYAGSIPDYRQELQQGLVYGRNMTTSDVTTRQKWRVARRRRKRRWKRAAPHFVYYYPKTAVNMRTERPVPPRPFPLHEQRQQKQQTDNSDYYYYDDDADQQSDYYFLDANKGQGQLNPGNQQQRLVTTSTTTNKPPHLHLTNISKTKPILIKLGSAHSPTASSPQSATIVDQYYNTRYAASISNQTRGHPLNNYREPYTPVDESKLQYKQSTYQQDNNYRLNVRPITDVQVTYKQIATTAAPPQQHSPSSQQYFQEYLTPSVAPPHTPKTYRITTERPTIATTTTTTSRPQQQQQQQQQQQNLYYEKNYPAIDPNTSSDYYVYDDDYDATVEDYPEQQQQPHVARATTTTTKKPSRGSTHYQSSNTGSSRPTLKPSQKLLKNHQPSTVRDVYLDLPSRPQNVYATPAPDTSAKKCNPSSCQLPDCYCGGKAIPGGLKPSQVPQIVMITFDDSVNDLNKGLYKDLFEKGRRNPNGCPISATFYVSHEWTDYGQVQNLASEGHEIASHSVSHSFGEQFTQRKWDKEITGQREILAAYAGVKLNTIRGMRAPFLAIGGNNMFKMLYESNWTYDSSMPVYENNPPSWPYTLDYKPFHDCMIPPCPTKSYPGVWEVPMVMWQDLKGGRCSMADACSNPPDAEGVYSMLAKNFERHYNSNRAPFGMYYHAAWFTQAHHKEGFIQFLDTLVQMDDVYVITSYQALEWVRNPTPLNQILNFEPWQCDSARNLNDLPPACKSAKVCNLWHKSGVRYLKTCQPCPEKYPWTGETGVVSRYAV